MIYRGAQVDSCKWTKGTEARV